MRKTAPKPASAESRPAESRPAESAPAAPRLEERLSFLVHKINARLAQVANQLFKLHQIDLFSSRILVFLLERREMRVGELVEAMVLPQSTMSHQLQRLEKRRLIKRRRTREDNRSVAVALTPLGLEVAEQCNQLSLEVYASMIGSLDGSEIEQLRGSLTRIFTALENWQPSPVRAAEAAAAAPKPRRARANV